MMRPADFKPGMFVRYVPYHAHDDLNHPDCELGVVTSSNDTYVFVRLGLHNHSQACKADQLVEVK